MVFLQPPYLLSRCFHMGWSANGSDRTTPTQQVEFVSHARGQFSQRKSALSTGCSSYTLISEGRGSRGSWEYSKRLKTSCLKAFHNWGILVGVLALQLPCFPNIWTFLRFHTSSVIRDWGLQGPGPSDTMGQYWWHWFKASPGCHVQLWTVFVGIHILCRKKSPKIDMSWAPIW